jgi:hypothetical protein
MKDKWLIEEVYSSEDCRNLGWFFFCWQKGLFVKCEKSTCPLKVK